MSEAAHLDTARMNAYARRALDAPDLLLADDHLAGCAECRARLIDDQGLRHTVRALQIEIAAALPAGTEHLPYDQVEALAEDRLRGAAREIAVTHVEDCPSCAAEIDDLRAFAAAFREARRAAAAALAAGAPGRADGAVAERGGPGSRPAIASTGQDAAQQAGAEPLTLAARPRTARKVLWPAAAILVVAGAAGAAWMLRARYLDLRAQVDVLKQDNQALEARAAEADTLRAALEQKSAEGAAAAPAAITLTDVAAPGAGPAGAGKTGAAGSKPGAVAAAPGPIGLDTDGQLTGLDALPLAEGRVVALALRRGRLDIPDSIADLSVPPPGPETSAPVPVSPVGTVVRGQRPVLSWEELPGATAYAVVVTDAAGAVAARADGVRGLSWTVPRSLKRGATYAWRVWVSAPAGAAGASPAAGTARFRVLDQEEAAAFDRALKACGGSALVAGVLGARAGLLDDAEKSLRALVDANPGSAEVRALLQRLLEERVRRAGGGPPARGAGNPG